MDPFKVTTENLSWFSETSRKLEGSRQHRDAAASTSMALDRSCSPRIADGLAADHPWGRGARTYSRIRVPYTGAQDQHPQPRAGTERQPAQYWPYARPRRSTCGWRQSLQAVAGQPSHRYGPQEGQVTWSHSAASRTFGSRETFYNKLLKISDCIDRIEKKKRADLVAAFHTARFITVVAENLVGTAVVASCFPTCVAVDPFAAGLTEALIAAVAVNGGTVVLARLTEVVLADYTGIGEAPIAVTHFLFAAITEDGVCFPAGAAVNDEALSAYA